MNPYTTDHPMVSQPSWFDARLHPRLSYLCQILVVALAVFAAFAGIWIFALMDADNEDVTDPSWTDDFFFAIGLCSAFPAFIISRGVGPASDFFLWCGLGLDSFFWAWVMVSVYRMMRRWILRKRFGLTAANGETIDMVEGSSR